MNHSVTAEAPGKINLYFEVGSLQADGYHEVASVYLALALRERVTVTASDQWSVEVSGSLSDSHLSAVPTGEENLVVQAAKLVAAGAGLEVAHPLHFAIDKSVPVAGGMGGGSADAAAAFSAANALYCTGLSDSDLAVAAANLGADVPFALMGGAAIGTGRGDLLIPIDDVHQTHWVLVANHGGLSTPSVYQKLDQLRLGRGQSPEAMPHPEVPAALIQALREGNPHALAGYLRNDLQECAIMAKPELAETIRAGLEAGALAGMVSGSGPTVALLAESAAAAEAIANRLSILGFDALPTFGPTPGATIEVN